MFDELFGVAGIWNDEGEWAHIWPGELSDCSLLSTDKYAATVDAFIASLEGLAQARRNALTSCATTNSRSLCFAGAV